MDFVNEPWLDFSLEKNQKILDEALQHASDHGGKSCPLLIDGNRVFTGDVRTSTNPSDTSETIGNASVADAGHVDDAVEAAGKAFESWRFVKPEERARYLFSVAENIRENRMQLIALVMKEAGKTRVEADADVCEAIDFLEYYGREMIRIGSPYRTQFTPGEINEVTYIPRGVAVVIAPWNFPLAILTGMVSAALVAGNTVIMKPSGNTPVIGWRLMEMYLNAGIPAGVLNFLPGSGEEVGERLVNHPNVSLIAFTGSKDVGLRIVQLASVTHHGQKNVKRVIGEFGGKNAVIVDESADIDAAVQGIAASAFGYSGQKCSAASRVIAVEPVYDRVLEELVALTGSVKIGRAEEPETLVGPVISREQLEKIRGYIEIGKKEAVTALERETPALNGHYVGPVIFADVPPESRIAQEEIFGPVVSVIRARNMDEALRIANGTRYGLTAGIYAQDTEIIEKFKREIDAGNRYINRKITGSIVERQPFGGYKMSGIGSKAGGRDYLPQFMIPVSVSENVA